MLDRHNRRKKRCIAIRPARTSLAMRKRGAPGALNDAKERAERRAAKETKETRAAAGAAAGAVAAAGNEAA